jgi:site-specific recombinase XerD
MASLYFRNGSPYHWVKFRHPITFKVLRESTGFLRNDPVHRQRARQLLAEKNLFEAKIPRSNSEHRWDLWVPAFLKTRHGEPSRTLDRNMASWRILSAYLAHKEIAVPEQITRQHCMDFVPWRRSWGHRNSPALRRLSINTIIMDLKTLGCIMQEAVSRQWCEYNPCHRLGIKRARPREKDEMSDDQIAFIRERIRDRQREAASKEEMLNAEFLHISFEIAIHQGCRLSETWLPLSAVDLDNLEIEFIAKGDQTYKAPLNPALVPLLSELKRRNQKHTYDRPKMGGLKWFKFFDTLRKQRTDLANVSFHSSRVTVVSRAERNGVQEKVTMQLVNHSSTTVHRVYRKIKRHELKAVWTALASLSSSDTPGSSETSGSAASTVEPPRG